MGTDFSLLPVPDLIRLYRARKLSPVEVTQRCLRQIAKYNPVLNAVCFMDEKAALREARASEKRWAKNAPRGALDGIPATIKDWFDVKGWPTRYGSRMYGDAPQADDSLPVARLREAGAVIIAKTTLPEFGHMGVTDSPLTGITRNPWNPAKTSGGSSGGAAVAAATGMAPLNLGSDAGGSIRIPASFSGVFGFKPSPGVVPSWPPSPFSSFSSVGPLTRSVRDAAAMMDALARPDARDWNAAPCPPAGFAAALGKPLAKLKIAWAPSLDGAVPEKSVLDACGAAVKHLAALGRVEEIELHAPQMTDIFAKHWMAIVSWHVSHIPPAKRKGFSPGYLRWAAAGDALGLHEYIAAEKERMMTGAYFKGILDSYDLLVTPALRMTAFDAGESMPEDSKKKPWPDFWAALALPANIAKLPAASLPVGFAKDGLPVGLQVMGGYLKDKLVLQACARLEEAIAFPGWRAA